MYFLVLSAGSTSTGQMLVSNDILQKKKESGLPEKWLILKLGQKMYKMNLKYLIEPESMDRLLSPSK